MSEVFRKSQKIAGTNKRFNNTVSEPEINHPIPTLHPDSCFLWIVARYSRYLRAVSNRISFQITGHGTPIY